MLVRKPDLSATGWQEVRHDYYVNEDLNTAREIAHIQDKEEQNCARRTFQSVSARNTDRH